MAHEVKLVEQSILIDAGLATIDNFANPVEWPQISFEICGKSLSEVDPHERHPYSVPSAPYIDEPLFPVLVNNQPAEDAVFEQPPANNRGTPDHKRKRGPEEGEASELQLAISDEQPGSQKRRRVMKKEIPSQPPAEIKGTSGYKRKRGSEGDDHGQPPLATPEGQPGPQKRRRMIGKEIQSQPPVSSRPAPAGVASGSKRKRRSDMDCEAQPVPDEPEAKKRKVVREEITAANVASRRDRRTRTRHSSRAKPAALRESSQQRMQPSPTTLTPRVTRARRRQLSGADAQLLQLGQDGRADVQVQTDRIQRDAPEAATERPRHRRSAGTKTRGRVQPATSLYIQVSPIFEGRVQPVTFLNPIAARRDWKADKLACEACVPVILTGSGAAGDSLVGQ
ncbi:hypothetical protein M406DRAFT_326868 [Cryphonectria parasitica EP155]|uniref:Uncharacterized protein n=1 Tax=Cryphonectria parasitica (strain ATCC 38755 / EP155) TaxID=660469 RepID=A0A9P4Y8H6_CRYP1|nr:uncharacterized protein M406DRAFT_326868 [Cryphonectria parasitica EP155]KAF3768359.1 hypothetical protein M406DRAFT_326868 [Cryphonectria parasitica EP155]